MRVLVRESAWWLLLWVCLPACGRTQTAPPDEAPPETTQAVFRDGQRLLAKQFRFDGTEPLFFGIYDQDKHVDCEFALAADGSQRCLPGGANYVGTEAPSAWVSGQAGPGNTNPSRMQPLVVESEDGGRFPDQSKLFDTQTGQSCEGGYSIDRDGTGSGGFCEILVDIVPRGSGRLSLATLSFEGSDVKPILLGTAGDFNAAPYFDNERGLLCGPIWTQQDGVRCIPQGTSTVLPRGPGAQFADATCTTPVTSGAESGLAVELAATPLGALPLVSGLRQLGARLDANRFFLQDGGCVPGFSNVNGFAVGDTAPLSELALVSVFPPQAADR